MIYMFVCLVAIACHLDYYLAMKTGRFSVHSHTVESHTGYIRDQATHDPAQGLFKIKRLGIQIAEQESGSFLLKLSKKRTSPARIEYGAWDQGKAISTIATVTPSEPAVRIWPHLKFAEFLMHAKQKTLRVILKPPTA